MVCSLAAVQQHIVYINLYCLINKVSKDFVNEPLTSRLNIFFQAKEYDFMAIEPPIYDERGAFLVRCVHRNQVTP